MNSNLILVDYRISKTALKSLEKYGEVVLFKTEGIVYDAISGHPDIFIFQNEKKIVVAPNIPDKYIYLFENHLVDFILGEKSLGLKYPETSYYNAVAAGGLFIYNPKNTDSKVIEISKHLKSIAVNQGYTRCNTMMIDEELVLTSDKKLAAYGENYFFIPPQKIILESFDYGFFGGCCGFYNQRLFINGKFNEIENHSSIRKLIEKKNIEIVELQKGNLADVGGIFFI
jgi:hypothetical protein